MANQMRSSDLMKSPIALMAVCLAAACATASVRPAPDHEPEPDPAPRIVVTDIDRLVARSLLEPIDSTMFVSIPQRDSLALAVAHLRSADSLLNEILGDHSAKWLESVQILLGFGDPGRRDSTFIGELGACAGAVQDTFVPYRGGAGFSRRAVPKGCWPTLDSALSMLPNVEVSLAEWYHDGPMSVEVFTHEPVDRYAFARYLRERLGESVVWNSLLNDWPPITFARVNEGWLFTLVRGYGDCPSGCINQRDYPFLYDPSTGQVTKRAERGDPWPPPPKKPFAVDTLTAPTETQSETPPTASPAAPQSAPH